MSENRTLKSIGQKLREESRDIVDAKLPERLRILLQRLAGVEDHDELNNGSATMH